jgi:hypothetical protein
LEDCVRAIRPAIAAALTPLGAKLYVNQRSEPDGTVRVPHGFVWSVTETEGAFYGQLEDLIFLQLFAKNLDELQAMENAVEFLDDYYPASFGNALNPRYKREAAIQRVPEGGGRWQSTISLTARYTDARKWN